jgi:ribosomal protein S27AE
MIARRDPEKVRSADRRRYWRNHEKRREVNAEYRRKHPDYFRETSAAWAARNPEKRQATWTLNNAVRDGKITKEPCEVCGEAKVEAHHDDYSKPLDVRWLCLAHHGQQHIVYRDEFEEVMAS